MSLCVEVLKQVYEEILFMDLHLNVLIYHVF